MSPVLAKALTTLEHPPIEASWHPLKTHPKAAIGVMAIMDGPKVSVTIDSAVVAPDQGEVVLKGIVQEEQGGDTQSRKAAGPGLPGKDRAGNGATVAPFPESIPAAAA